MEVWNQRIVVWSERKEAIRRRVCVEKVEILARIGQRKLAQEGTMVWLGAMELLVVLESPCKSQLLSLLSLALPLQMEPSYMKILINRETLLSNYI